MATKTWKSVSKFRLFTIVGFSVMTSLSLSMGESLWTIKDAVSAILQAAIAGFAYLQCPTIKETDETQKESEKQ